MHCNQNQSLSRKLVSGGEENIPANQTFIQRGSVGSATLFSTWLAPLGVTDREASGMELRHRLLCRVLPAFSPAARESKPPYQCLQAGELVLAARSRMMDVVIAQHVSSTAHSAQLHTKNRMPVAPSKIMCHLLCLQLILSGGNHSECVSRNHASL